MTPQEATEAANINSYQMHSSFGAHESRPGAMMIHPSLPPYVRAELTKIEQSSWQSSWGQSR